MEKEQCLTCRYLRPISGGCAAYPDGIPYEIADGTVIHDKVMDNQQGVFVHDPGEPEELRAIAKNQNK